MLQHYIVLAAVVCCSVVSSCKKSTGGDSPLTGKEENAIQPAGTTTGSEVIKTIGAAGGTLESGDGIISVIVPAGALNSNVQLSVQSLTNTCEPGIGAGYRLLPHGQQFAKEVQIRINYSSLQDSITSLQTLGIAFQDEQGVWNMVADPVIDNAGKTITINSTHFSDWTLMSWIKVSPASKTIGTGESVVVKALQYVRVSDEDLLYPLVENSKVTPVIKVQPLPTKYVKEWYLGGKGTLTAQGNKAVYTAPPTVPAANPQAVTLSLRSKQQVLILSNITVTGDVLEFRIGGGEWQQLEAIANMLDDKHNSIGTTATTGQNIVLVFPKGTGSFPWLDGMSSIKTAFRYIPDIRNVTTAAISEYYKDKEDDVIISSGSVNISAWGNPGEYVTGTFLVSPAGFFSIATGKQTQTATVEGRFRLKRLY